MRGVSGESKGAGEPATIEGQRRRGENIWQILRITVGRAGIAITTLNSGQVICHPRSLNRPRPAVEPEAVIRSQPQPFNRLAYSTRRLARSIVSSAFSTSLFSPLRNSGNCASAAMRYVRGASDSGFSEYSSGSSS